MACLSTYTLKGIPGDCNPNLAGIKEAYIGYQADYDIEVSTSGETIQTVTSASLVSGGTKMKKYVFNKQTGSLTSNLTKDEANGTRYWTNEVVLQFTKMEAWKHFEMQALASEQLAAVIVDNNNKKWYVGYDGYLSAAEGAAQTGQSYDDMNGYNLTMNAMSAYLPFEIDDTNLAAIADV